MHYGCVLLLPQGHNVNAVTIDHVSPLHEACFGGHVACARALVAAGANVSHWRRYSYNQEYYIFYETIIIISK